MNPAMAKPVPSNHRDGLALLADLIARQVVDELGRVPKGNRPKQSEGADSSDRIEAKHAYKTN